MESDNDRWQLLKEYQQQQRQAQAAREQRASAEQHHRQQEALEQHAQREQDRRTREAQHAEERQRVQEEIAETRRQEDDALLARMQQLASEQRRIDQQRQEALLLAAQKLKERARLTASGKSFVEEMFLDAWKARYPDLELEPQHNVDRRRLDFYHRPSRIVIEVDGRRFHTDRKPFVGDRQRDRYLQWHVVGHEKARDVVRFAASELLEDIDAVVEEAHTIIMQAMSEDEAR